MTGTDQPCRVYHPIAIERIDPDVIKVIRRLRRFEHQAYLVGGCVRDLLLEAKPKDFDVATSAKPREVRKLFRNSKVIGRRFQLVHIFFRGGKIIEVATFRQAPKEGENPDDLLITDDNVFGVASEDARRRDFTINALFYDLHSREIVDFVAGLDDIDARLVRAIGDPEVRMREDPVRMLRAVKFASRLSLRIEESLWEASCSFASELERAAKPRVLEEIYRLLRPGVASASLALLQDSKMADWVLPALSQFLPAAESEAESGDLQARFEGLLKGFDAAVAGRSEPPSNALILAVLHWLPWQQIRARAEAEAEAEAEAPEGKRVDYGRVLDTQLRPVLVEMRVPRREQEMLRLMFMSQARFEPSRRRRKTEQFVRRSYFTEALALYEIRQRAKGASLESVQRWRARASLPLLAEAAPVDAGDFKPGSRKRRRRRRRRKPSPPGGSGT